MHKTHNVHKPPQLADRETEREGGAGGDGDGIDTADVSLEYCGKCIIQMSYQTTEQCSCSL